MKCRHFWRKRHAGLKTGRVHCERCCLTAAIDSLVDAIIADFKAIADSPEVRNSERFETLDQFHASKYGATNSGDCICGAPIVDGLCSRRIAEESGEKYDG